MHDSTGPYLIDEEHKRISDESFGTPTHEIIHRNVDMNSEVSDRIDTITPVAGNCFSAESLWLVFKAKSKCRFCRN